MTYVDYDAIPIDVRMILDESFADPAEAEAWWNKPNMMLRHFGVAGDYKMLYPRNFPEASKDLANAMADGLFPKETPK